MGLVFTIGVLSMILLALPETCAEILRLSGQSIPLACSAIEKARDRAECNPTLLQSDLRWFQPIKMN
jgi:hypothetical protein